jgi:hypothetical protein
MASLGSLIDEPGDAPQVDADGVTTEEVAGAVEAKTLEVAGVITDDQGHTWQVPGDNVEDFDDLYAGEVYNIPNELTQKFHYQLVPHAKMRDYAQRRFVPVTLEELSIPAEFKANTGQPLDSYHNVGDCILMKIPRVIHERLQARKIKEVKRRLREMEPTEAMLQRAKQSGIIMKVERQTGATIVGPKVGGEGNE